MKSFALKDRLKELRLFKRRMLIISLSILLLTIILICRFLYLQVIQFDLHKTLSIKNSISLIPVEPKRGLIFDRNGVLLANNVAVMSLVVTPGAVKHLDKKIHELKKIINLSDNEIKQFKKQMQKHRPFDQVALRVKLSEDDIARFSVNHYKFSGFSVSAKLIRAYLYGDQFANILGYVGRINAHELATIDLANYADSNFIGKDGIEKYYENILHGTIGYKQIEVDASGEPIRTVGTIVAKAGSNLYLTIDSNLQITAQEALQNYRGAAVAIDPNNGEILALASNPSFDPNIFVHGINDIEYQNLLHDPYRPMYNRAVHGLYAPGSTIKPIIALAGLNENVISPNYEIFDADGKFRIEGDTHVFHDWKHKGHGWVNVTKAIAESSDVFFYNLALNLGINRLDDILNQFGFGRKTLIDICGESAGNLPTPDWKYGMYGARWYSGDTILTGIGQSYFQATPLQLANAVAILAGHGVGYQSHLLYKKVTEGKTEVTNLIQLPPVMIDANQYWDTVIDGMQKVITLGTGYRFGHASYTVAAKTGTAQVVSLAHQRAAMQINNGDDVRDNSLFIAFAPIDKPKIAVAVIIEHNPDAPIITRKIIDAYLLQKNDMSRA